MKKKTKEKIKENKKENKKEITKSYFTLDSVKGFNVYQRFMGALYNSLFLALYEHPSIGSVSQNVFHRSTVPIARSIRKTPGQSIGTGVLDRSG